MSNGGYRKKPTDQGSKSQRMRRKSLWPHTFPSLGGLWRALEDPGRSQILSDGERTHLAGEPDLIRISVCHAVWQQSILG